jgi:hypothetical protein
MNQYTNSINHEQHVTVKLTRVYEGRNTLTEERKMC